MKTDDIKIIRTQRRHILDVIKSLKINTKSFLNGGNDEALHDLRVALRRLQAVTVLFEKIFAYQFDEDYKKSTKNILSFSSSLRDIEEFERFTHLEYDTDVKDEYMKNLVLILENSDLWSGVLCEYMKFFRWLTGNKKLDGDHRKTALEHVIEALEATSKKYEKAILSEPLNFEELHSVRKRCKRYRYQLDFIFMDSNEGSMVCKKMQDKLGNVNDLRSWAELIKTFGGQGEIALKIDENLKDALDEAKAEGRVFASKKYCGYLFDALRKRLAML